MKSIVPIICIMILAITGLRAQTGELLVKKGEKGLYIDHKVTAKENFYSIGRLFNVHPKYLASYNAFDMSKGLSLGQSIKIPLTDTNFIQNADRGAPVYYVAGEKDKLSSVSNANKKVSIENLRQWNHLSGDNVSKGQKLIVGFLVSKEMQNTAVNNIIRREIDNNKQESESVNKPEPEKKEVKQEKQEEKKTDPVIGIREEVKPRVKEQGYFKSSFDQQIKQQPLSKEQTVTSGIFKTTSGWTDAKYYLLMDGVEPGTIIKIINPINSKMIYAKVLGEMNGLKQGQGLNIRISNAAASTLGIEETDKFIVRLNY